MANNYALFSAALPLRNADEANYVVELLENGIPELKEEAEDWGWPTFEWSLEQDRLWMYSEESFNADFVASVVAELFKKFPREEGFAFTWALTCSKPRLDEFDGGACVVSGDGERVEWMCAGNWARQKLEEFKKPSS